MTAARFSGTTKTVFATTMFVRLALPNSGLRAADAHSREVSVFNNLTNPVPFSDAISREVSVYNDLSLDQFADANSREVSVYNDLSDPDLFDDANSREVSVYNDLNPTLEFTDANSREVSVLNFRSGVEFDSNDGADARALVVNPNTLPNQLNALNAAPPAFDASWTSVARDNRNQNAAFTCGGVPDPLDQPYLSADEFFLDLDEVTFDNCGSAHYRFTFDLPARFAFATLTGTINVDDQGVAWLNGTRISGLMTVPACNPTAGAGDPCYLLQDAGHDRVDAQGRRILTWPSQDGFSNLAPNVLRPGENELIFAVAGDAQFFEPTGLEFAAAALFYRYGDMNCDGVLSVGDIAGFVLALTNVTQYRAEFPVCHEQLADTNGDGGISVSDIGPFVALLTGG